MENINLENKNCCQVTKTNTSPSMVAGLEQLMKLTSFCMVKISSNLPCVHVENRVLKFPNGMLLKRENVLVCSGEADE